MLSFGLSGYPGPEDEHNPFHVVYKTHHGDSLPILETLCRMADADSDQISSQTGLPLKEVAKRLEDLKLCGLVDKTKEGRHRVSFAAFDSDIWQLFDQPMRRATADLASMTRDTIQQLHDLYEETDIHGCGSPFPSVCAIVMGAFGMDESGVSQLDQEGIIQVAKPQPGGRRFTILADLGATATRYPLYGIHSERHDGVAFSCFGENSQMNRRRSEIKAIPDLLWYWKDQGKSLDEISSFAAWIAYLAKRFANQHFSPGDLESSLPVALGCENGLLSTSDGKKYRLRFPVFTSRDMSIFAPIREGIGEIVVKSTRANLQLFDSAYKRTRFSKQGVSLPEVMNRIYHHTYSLAFDELMSSSEQVSLPHHNGLPYIGYATLSD